jgi:HAD superfamily hydrolase (TIGR01509 family)
MADMNGDDELDGFAVIFDNDGIIFDTEPLHFKARQDALLPLGIQLTKEQYIREGISRGHREFLGKVVPPDVLPPERYDRFFREEIQARYHALRECSLPTVKGFDRLLLYLVQKGLTLAVASTQPRETVLSGLQSRFTESEMLAFRAIVSGEDVKRNKPAPDVYLEAARLLEVEPGKCIAVEDSVSGVRSAKAAGMICVARRNDWADDAALVSAGADALCEPDYCNWMMLVSIVLRARRLGRF